MCRRPPPANSSHTGLPAERAAMTSVAKDDRSRFGDWLTLDLLQCGFDRRGSTAERLSNRMMLSGIQFAGPFIHEKLFHFDSHCTNRMREVLVNPAGQLAAEELHVLSYIQPAP